MRAGLAAPEPDSVLRMEDVHKAFATPSGTVDVLCGADLEAKRGETLAVVGASGSGKSTLLSLLAGLDVPTRGRVCVEGLDLAELSEQQLSRYRGERLGIVFQQFHLMDGLSALENVSLPLELRGAPDAPQRAREALAQVGLSGRVGHSPARLSGGECQRVAIARALIVEPALLLADEPSGSLDERTGEAVVQLMFDLVSRRSTTLVLVTHSERLASACGRSLHLVAGRLD